MVSIRCSLKVPKFGPTFMQRGPDLRGFQSDQSSAQQAYQEDVQT